MLKRILNGFKGLFLFLLSSLFLGLKRLSYPLLVVSIVSLVSIISNLYAPKLHESYLRNKVGQVIIKMVANQAANSGGTGFHVKTASGQTLILTNAHVCKVNGEGAIGSLVLVVTPDGKRQVKSKILDIAKDADLCLVEGMAGIDGVSLGSSADIGQQIAIIGHPYLNPLAISRGQIISKKDIVMLYSYMISKEECLALGDRYSFEPFEEGSLGNFFGYPGNCLEKHSTLETNAVTYPGNSGSPVVNFFGNLIGVIFAGDNRTNWGYMVPLEKVRDFLSVW